MLTKEQEDALTGDPRLKMDKKESHYGLWHFCGGCSLGDKFHTGCFATKDAKEVKFPIDKQGEK
ncbi:MAG: hypothetical protein AAB506_00830 [Patescibacteria group bacterium]